jgi:small subunit ribosomal protein S13
VRIAGQDLDGTKKVVPSLADLRGLGTSLAQHLLTALKIDPKLRLGQLSEGQVRELEEALRDPSRLGLPAFVLNRPKDPETGSNLHLVGADWQLVVKTDIEREKSVLSWRGLRHSLGLKVRGQRTRTTGRKGRAVGVRKAALEAAAAAARAAEEKK